MKHHALDSDLVDDSVVAGRVRRSIGLQPGPLGGADHVAADRRAIASSRPRPTAASQPTQSRRATVAGFRADLPDLGDAPELNNEVWLNTDRPLRLSDLRGKVVLLDMWTFGCINCRNVIPSLREWHGKYADQGLVVIGNHYPGV